MHEWTKRLIALVVNCAFFKCVCHAFLGNPEKKLPPDQEALLRLLHRWRDEITKAGRTVTRITVAFEAGRDGLCLARWLLRVHGIEAHVIHPTSIPVSREHRRAKTDRLDIALLKRAFLGWLRGRDRSLQYGRDPDLRRGGRQAAEP
jgi:transposase